MEVGTLSGVDVFLAVFRETYLSHRGTGARLAPRSFGEGILDMATYTKRRTLGGLVSWRVRVRIAGRYESTTFATQREAQQWAAEKEGELRRLGPAPVGGPVSFEEALARYLANVPRTDLDRGKLKWWAERFEGMGLESIGAREISAGLAALAKGETPSGRNAAPATVCRYAASIGTFFSWCERDAELIASNPVRRVRRPKEPRGRLPNLTGPERARLLSVCREVDPRLGDLVTVLLATGARRGEVLRLRRKDIDLGKGVAIIEDTKNGDRRRMHLAGPALEVVRARIETLPVDPAVYVFAASDRPPDREPEFPRNAWRRARKQAGLPSLRVHDLRHVAASAFLEAGASLGELRELLGHRSPQMTARYAHLAESRARESVERAARLTFEAQEIVAGIEVYGTSDGGNSGAGVAPIN